MRSSLKTFPCYIIEVMEQGRAVWLGIYLNNGKMYHLNIGGDNLYVNYSYEGNINETL